MRRHALLLAALCLALAGCNGLSASDGGDGTLTPAPVPNETDRPANVPATDLPPGVTSTAIEDLGKLLAAHEAQLANQSYVLRGERRVVGAATGSEPEWQARQFTVTVANATTYDLTVRQRNSVVDAERPDWYNYSIYATRSDALSRIDNESGVYYTVPDRLRQLDQFLLIVTSRLDRVMAAGPATVDRVERGGEEYVRIRQRNASSEAGDGTPTYQATLLVEPDGTIHRARVRYRDPAAQRQAATIRTVTFHYRAVGSVEPEPPAWLPRARANLTGS